jgi:hypothetical protein
MEACTDPFLPPPTFVSYTLIGGAIFNFLKRDRKTVEVPLEITQLAAAHRARAPSPPATPAFPADIVNRARDP